jgi:hypothetical protein
VVPAVAPSAVSSGRPALSSELIGMNLLMVRPDLAIVDDAQRDLALALQRRRGHRPHPCATPARSAADSTA